MALKFNIGDTKQVTMKYDTGKHVDGKFGPQVMFGVTVDGQDDYWYVSPFVNGLFESNEVKAGDTLTVTRSGQKQYVYMKDGQVLMTKPGFSPKPQPQSSDLEQRVKRLETEVAFIKGKLGATTPENVSKEQIEANNDVPEPELYGPPPGEEVKLEDIPF